MPIVENQSAKIAYNVRGKGPDLILIQGAGVPATGWTPQLDALSQRYRVTTLDNRGIGQSTRGSKPISVALMIEDVIAVMDHAGIKRAHIGGHSMGTLLATHLGLKHPDRVRSLSLICSVFRSSEVAGLSLWKAWVGLRCHVGTRITRRRAFLEMLLPDGVMSLQERDALALQLEGVFGRDLALQPSIVMSQVQAMRRHPHPESFEALHDTPCLIISGGKDRMTPPEQGEQLAKALKNPFECWEDSAHGLPIMEAERLNQAWLTFLQDVDQGQTNA